MMVLSGGVDAQPANKKAAVTSQFLTLMSLLVIGEADCLVRNPNTRPLEIPVHSHFLRNEHAAIGSGGRMDESSASDNCEIIPNLADPSFSILIKHRPCSRARAVRRVDTCHWPAARKQGHRSDGDYARGRARGRAA